jgi:hypothetical protein
MTTINVSETIAEWANVFDQKYNEEEKQFDLDPLVLACSCKDLVKRTGGYYSLDGVEVRENVTDAIKAEAEAVRKYYTKKYFWANFQSKLSDYRTRVCYLLEHRISKIKDQDQGIYYKLPWFYEEDMIYDDFKLNLITTDISPLGSSRGNKFTKRLEFLKTSFSSQRKRKITRYWFKDDNNFLYGIELQTDNPLLPMFEQYLTDNPTPLMETRLAEDRIDKMEFYKMYSYKFLKETNA